MPAHFPYAKEKLSKPSKHNRKWHMQGRKLVEDWKGNVRQAEVVGFCHEWEKKLPLPKEKLLEQEKFHFVEIPPPETLWWAGGGMNAQWLGDSRGGTRTGRRVEKQCFRRVSFFSNYATWKARREVARLRGQNASPCSTVRAVTVGRRPKRGRKAHRDSDEAGCGRIKATR